MVRLIITFPTFSAIIVFPKSLQCPKVPANWSVKTEENSLSFKSLLNIFIFPDSLLMIFNISLINVVLPAPFSPIKPITSPDRIFNFSISRVKSG